MRLTLTLPWPPANISPNAKRRLDWTQYTGAVHGYRRACWALTREAMGREIIGRGIMGAVKAVSITFAPPDARGRDDDNMICAFKPGRDGIAQALGHDDKTWKGRVAYQFDPPHRPDGKITVAMEFDA